jgi:hypothetical protein
MDRLVYDDVMGIDGDIGALLGRLQTRYGARAPRRARAGALIRHIAVSLARGSRVASTARSFMVRSTASSMLARLRFFVVPSATALPAPAVADKTSAPMFSIVSSAMGPSSRS